jgi:sarcosine oxidase
MARNFTTERCEYVVIGLGALGSAVAYQLARRGAQVVAVEQFELGHSRGASHDTSRILRHSYHTPAYVELTKAAYRDWAVLESDAGESFVSIVGGLDLFPPNAAIGSNAYTESLAAADVNYELLTVDQVDERWPQFVLPAGTTGLYQDRGAILPAGRGTMAMQRLAATYGASLRDCSPVTELRELGRDLVEVTAAGVRYRCRRVIVCADAWTNQVLAGIRVTLPLTVTLEQVTYFQPDDPDSFAPERMPLWIWMDDPSYYGFPCYGEPTIKASQDCGGPRVDPDARTSEPDLEMQSQLANHLHRMLPGSGKAVRSLRCQYTLTPDRDLLLDSAPGYDSILVGLGAAHGFKFAPTLGRVLADLAMHGETDADLTAYGFDRPGIVDPGFTPTWMV